VSHVSRKGGHSERTVRVCAGSVRLTGLFDGVVGVERPEGNKLEVGGD